MTKPTTRRTMVHKTRINTDRNQWRTHANEVHASLEDTHLVTHDKR